MGTLKTTNIQTISGSGTLTLGTSGETLALGSGVTSNILYPAFQAYAPSDQALTSAVRTLASYSTEDFDTNNAYDNTASNYKFTVPTGYDGKYLFFASAHIISSNDGQLVYGEILFRKNDAAYVGRAINNFTGNNVRGTTPAISSIMDLTAGDYIQVHVRGAISANTVKMEGGSNGGKFYGYRIGT